MIANADRPAFAEAYLTVPDLFPGRPSGERWGDEEVALDLAGGPYRLVGLSPEQAAAARERYGPLVLPTLPGVVAAIEIVGFAAPTSDFVAVDTRGWENAFDLEYRRDSIAVAGRWLMARIDWTPELGGALWTPELAPDDYLCTLENFLRMVVAYRAVESGGALLHSAAVAVDGRAYLFVGQSGAGKSTLSGLSQACGYEVLSDELNVLKRRAASGGPALGGGALGDRVGEDDETPGLAVERLPFAGDFGQAAVAGRSYPLAGLFALAHAERAAVEPLAASCALATLSAAAPYVNADPFRGDRLLDNLIALAARAPMRRLAFRIAPDFWDILLGER